MVRIRRYEAGDAGIVSQIIRTTMLISNTADYSLEHLQPLVDYFSPAKVEHLSHERVCLVAEENGHVVGTAALDGNELATFFVHPDYQRRGIGTALLQELEAIAIADGIEQIEVASSLTGAGFYERHGYCRTGTVLDGTAGAQIVLCKRL